MQHQQRVLDGAGHRTELVKRPAERHRAGARHASIRGPQSGDSAAHAGADDAAAGLAANREADESSRRGRPRPGAGARRSFLQQPRVHRLSPEPDVIQCQRAEAELGDQHGARSVQPFHHGGVFFRNAVAVRLRAIGCGNSGGVQKILPAPWNSVQRPAVLARGDFFVGLLRLRQRQLARQRDDATQRNFASNCSMRFR